MDSKNYASKRYFSRGFAWESNYFDPNWKDPIVFWDWESRHLGIMPW